MSQVIDEIRSTNRNFMDTFARGDADGLAAFYTSDATLLPSDSRMMNGRAAIRSFWAGAINSGVKEAKLETVQVDTRDNLAYEIGKYALTVQAQDGQRSTAAGKYVVVWKAEEGAWKLHVDIWNNGVS